MKFRSLGTSLFLLLAVFLATGCSASYPPLTQAEIPEALEGIELPDSLVKLSNRSSAEFDEAYAQTEQYTPKYPSASAICQAVGEFSRVAQFAQGGKSWKQYMPADLRGFDLLGGKHLGLSTSDAADDFANASLDIAVVVFGSPTEASEFALTVRDNVEACFDFPKTPMPIAGLDLNVLFHASTLIDSDLELDGVGFSFEVVEDTYLELSKIAGSLEDSVFKENQISEVRQYGANLIVLVASSSSQSDARLGISAFTIADDFPQIFEDLGPALSGAAGG